MSEPPIQPQPAPEPQPLPTEQAAAAVREHMAQGLSLGEAVEKVGAAQGQPRVPPGRPEGGQWTTPEKPLESPVSPEPPEGGQPPAPVAEAPPAAEEGVQPPPEEAPPEPRVFVIDGETPFEIPIEDEETFERLSALQTQLAETRQRVAGIDAEQAQLMEQFSYIDDIDAVMNADPVGYLLQRIDDNPDVVSSIVRTLLVQDGVWERVGREVLSLDSPERRQIARARIVEERLDATDRVREAVKVNRNYREIEREVARLTPQHLTAEARAMFAYDALGDLQRHAETNRLRLIPKDKVQEVLQERIGLYASKAPANGSQPPVQEPQPPARKALQGRPKTGEQFVAADRTRRALAGAGAGGGPGPASGATPPEGLGLEETFEWHRKQMEQGRAVVSGLSQ